MRSLSVAGAALAVALVWGCGSGSSGTSTSPTSNSNVTTINIVGQLAAQSYSPNPGVVSQGALVAWHNNDTVAHHIVANDGSWDAGTIQPGATSAPMALNSAGTNYHCAIHPTTMNGGAITANAGAPPPPCQGAYC